MWREKGSTCSEDHAEPSKKAKNMLIGRDAILMEWTAAVDALDEARQLISGNKPNGSISRSYYSLLHSARTALLTQGVVTKSHRGLKTTFSKNLVLPGHFEKKWGNILQTASEARLEADYGAKGRLPLERAEDQAERANQFLERTRTFLKTQGFSEQELEVANGRDTSEYTPGNPGTQTPRPRPDDRSSEEKTQSQNPAIQRPSINPKSRRPQT